MRVLFGKFVIVFFVTTAINTVVWQYVAKDLYDCSDDNIPGYLVPGHWVHTWSDHPVVAVPRIVHNRSMNEPDIIKQGWSVTRLLFLWLALFAISVFVSVALARVPWSSSGRSNQSDQATAGRSDV